MDLFVKSSILCLKYVLKGSEYASVSLENTNNLSSENKVAHPKITTKTSAMKAVFSEGADRI